VQEDRRGSSGANGSRSTGFLLSMAPDLSSMSSFRPATVWTHYAAPEMDSTAPGSTIDTASASRGGKEMPKSRNATHKAPPVHPRDSEGDARRPRHQHGPGVAGDLCAGEPHQLDRRLPARDLGETALRLARYLGTTPEYWLNMQEGTIWKPPAISVQSVCGSKSGRATLLKCCPGYSRAADLLAPAPSPRPC
jgi:hypothetical protein